PFSTDSKKGFYYHKDIFIFIYYRLLINSSANSEHLTSFAPSIKRAKSYVTTLEAIVLFIDSVIKSAASFHPKCSNINTPDNKTDEGLTLSKPAYLGAVPCVASKIACPVM